MSRLLETICIEDGQAPLLPYHAERMQRSRYQLLKAKDALDLEAAISPLLSQNPRGLFKCRILYSRQIEEISCTPYQRPVIRSLKKVYCNDIDYAHKYEERSLLKQLYQRKQSCDDIIIIKNGWVSDTYIGNIMLYDGRGWYTPDTPLLCGVRRQYLLNQGQVRPVDIREQDLKKYQAFTFVNAMNPFVPSVVQDIRHIH